VEFVFGDHRLDVDRRELWRGAEPIALEPQVFDLLVYLVRYRDRVVSKNDLLAAVWGGRIVSESTLTSRISAVRKAVGDSGEAQRLIRTMPRKGLRFVGPVREEEAPATPVGVPPTVQGPSERPINSVPRLSIVVLPSANLSSDPDQEYFADGITDDLTTDLSWISESFVIARSTAFTYKSKPIDVKQISRELGVRYALEGSVRRAGDHVRVNVQLIDAENGSHLWADRFDTVRADLAETQNEITGRLARTLNLELVKTVSRRIEQQNAVDPDARDLVMRGWAMRYQPISAATRQEALRAFERALEIDPRSIDARIGIASTLVANLMDGWSGSFQQVEARAEELLLEALERDADRPMAH
jgi:TolB-like protein